MSCEFSANARQEIPAGGTAIFTASPVPCGRNLIYHRDESGLLRLASPSLIMCGCRPQRSACGCNCGMPVANYTVAFHGNLILPTGGTVETISLAIAVDGEIDPSSIMEYTPAAVEQPGNVGAAIVVAVPWICRCSSVSVRNNSTQAVALENANILFDFNGIGRA